MWLSIAQIVWLLLLFQPGAMTNSTNCTKTEAMDPQKFCDSIIEDVDISPWFTDEVKYGIDRQKQLKSAHGIHFKNTELEKFSLPNLKTVKNLEISGNKKLNEIDLGELVAVEKLTFKENGYPSFDVFPQSFAPKLEKFPDGYNLDTECKTKSHTIVTDLKQIQLCKRIVGSLMLEKLPEDNPEIFHVESVGCVAVIKTKLSSLHFLDKLKTSTCATHWIEDNPNLCARGYLEQLLKDPAHKVTLDNNKNYKDCPCIQSDIAIKGGWSSKCEKVRLYKPFSCKEYDSSRLIEAEGSLILMDCQDLEKSFANLKKITAVVKIPPLVVERDSDAPSVQFLRGIELVPSANRTTLIHIQRPVNISDYIPIKNRYGPTAVLEFPPSVPQGCYDRDDLYNASCHKYIGDLIAKNDEFRNSTIREITGCLIVLNGTQLDFLSNLTKAGEKCLYGNGSLYPHSPSKGYEKSTIQLAAGSCPLREERERLAAATGLTSMDFSGKDPECSKACTSVAQGNCDSFYGDLKVAPDQYLGNLEVLYGKLEIVDTMCEELEFPRLQAIHANTVPALLIHNNEELRMLHMPQLKNITSSNSSRPLIKITRNPYLPSAKEFLPQQFHNCKGLPDSECYESNSKPDEGGSWVPYIVLAVVIVLFITVPAVAYCVYTRSKKSGKKGSAPRASKRSSKSRADLGKGSKGATPSTASGSGEGKTATGRST